MKDGIYTFYAIQSRLVGKSPWLEPNGKIIPLDKEDEWSFSSFDHVAEPWGGKGNDYKPVHRVSYEETNDVRYKVGLKGWWTLEYASKALVRLIKGNEEGKLDYKDTYGKVSQACRYQFRIVMITKSQETNVVITGYLGAYGG